MVGPVACFVQQLLQFSGFRKSSFPPDAYQALLTALNDLPEQALVMIPELVHLANACPGCLIIDDTSTPKYGLKHWSRMLYNPATRGIRPGYKVLLFLWRCEKGYIPLGFALWHRDSTTLTQLALNGFSVLRNHYQLKPLSVLADAYFNTLEITKRLDDYGWCFVMRCKKNRKLSKGSVRPLIPRGYGDATGKLGNGVVIKVIRHGSHFLATNRKLLSRQAIQAFYRPCPRGGGDALGNRRYV